MKQTVELGSFERERAKTELDSIQKKFQGVPANAYFKLTESDDGFLVVVLCYDDSVEEHNQFVGFLVDNLDNNDPVVRFKDERRFRLLELTPKVLEDFIFLYEQRKVYSLYDENKGIVALVSNAFPIELLP